MLEVQGNGIKANVHQSPAFACQLQLATTTSFCTPPPASASVMSATTNCQARRISKPCAELESLAANAHAMILHAVGKWAVVIQKSTPQCRARLPMSVAGQNRAVARSRTKSAKRQAIARVALYLGVHGKTTNALLRAQKEPFFLVSSLRRNKKKGSATKRMKQSAQSNHLSAQPLLTNAAS